MRTTIQDLDIVDEQGRRTFLAGASTCEVDAVMLDKMIADIRDWHADHNAMLEGKILCIWCNERRPPETAEQRADGVVEHVKSCAKSPWRTLEILLRRIVVTGRAKRWEDFQDACALADTVIKSIDEGEIPDPTSVAAIIADWDANPDAPEPDAPDQDLK